MNADQPSADAREWNRRMDAADFAEEHGETPQERRERMQELQQDQLRDES